MKITIFNGNPDSSNRIFDHYLSTLAARLKTSQHRTEILICRDMVLKSCVGCWDCWVRTPGRCSHSDDTTHARHAILHSDLAIWASPLIMGFTSALLKTVQDKMVPIISPYFRMVQGEIHHRPRYRHYPKFGLLLGLEADTDEEDIAITKELYERLALNLISKLSFTATSNQPVEEVCYAINML
ncbi:NAD(P)H-dependent oxidoreductase [bacterium]|nr:NAD(P)H-dependent oxidoreductase [bacterium]